MFLVKLAVLIICCSMCFSCDKLVGIAPPSNSIITIEAFKDSANAVASVLGIYAELNQGNGSLRFANGALSLYCGISADEIKGFAASLEFDQLSNNTLLENNSMINALWTQFFSSLYRVNACIEGLEASEGISTALKARLLGETKFFRAFHNFYLVNLFGDVPLVNTTIWQEIAILPRADKALVYQAIVQDLLEAQASLPDDFTFSANERVRATRWAATALLARVYLYQEEWENANIAASALIGHNSVFNLGAPNQAFLKNNQEAILQWHQNPAFNPFNVTVEGSEIVRPLGVAPSYVLREELLNDFETGDSRQSAWVKEHSYLEDNYNLPFKYKLGIADQVVNGPTTEYYTVLRLAEQYLIRAEARAELDDLAGAKEDLNVIRLRAGLGENESTDLPSLKAAIMQERRIELFAEWGHRWFDLKRTGKVDEVLSAIKSDWQSYQQLYPIPFSELQRNPNLTQNPGYGN